MPHPAVIDRRYRGFFLLFFLERPLEFLVFLDFFDRSAVFLAEDFFDFLSFEPRDFSARVEACDPPPTLPLPVALLPDELPGVGSGATGGGS